MKIVDRWFIWQESMTGKEAGYLTWRVNAEAIIYAAHPLI